MRIQFYLLCIVLLSCAKPANKIDPLPWANPTSVKVSPQRLEAIAPAMQTYVDRGVVSGITTLVARHGKMVHWESTGFRAVSYTHLTLPTNREV